MQEIRLIPDSTFFSFFLHNTKENEALKKILEDFYVEVPPKIYEEIKCCRDYNSIDKISDKLHIFKGNLNFSELLKPAFSTEQKRRGEHDVIVVSYFCFELGVKFIMIIDDGGARKFVSKNFQILEEHMAYTANFISDCSRKYKVFNKGESLDLLEKMGQSTFRIDKQSLQNIMNDLK